MLDDYFTKPLQGRLFHMFIEVLMGWKHISTLHQISIPLKERAVDCIDAIKYSKRTYAEALTTVMSRPTSNSDNCVDVGK